MIQMIKLTGNSTLESVFYPMFMKILCSIQAIIKGCNFEHRDKTLFLQ